jgi:DNA excision repair protein ERCC-2
MITAFDPATRSLSVGIRELISLWWLPVTLRPAPGYLDLAARQRYHNSWQTKMVKMGWEKEVPVSLELAVRGIAIRIGGRIDLLRKNENSIEIVEVKTCFLPDPDRNPVADNLDHALQLSFYASALRTDPDTCDRAVRASLAYLPMLRRSEPEIIEIDPCSKDIAQAWEKLLDEVACEILEQEDRHRMQLTAMESFSFPFPKMRPGQDEMMEAAADTVRSGGRALVQAPAGTGKTVAVLAGSLPGTVKQNLALFFLTAKNTQKKIVRETLELIKSKGLGIRTLFLTSRESVCLNGTEYCRPDTCPWADEFAERVREHRLRERLLALETITPELLTGMAGEAAVCPFELSLVLSTKCDLIVCDYNYVFDPHVYLRRFFIEEATARRCAVLIDEAANLPSRARGYYSPQMRRSWFEDLISWQKRHRKPFSAMLSPWRKLFREISGELQGHSSEKELDPDKVLPLKERRWRQVMPEQRDPPASLIEIYRSILDFERIAEMRDGRFHLIFRRDEDGDVLQWFCTDASAFLAERHDNCHSTLAFSATLAPFEHFAYQLGLQSRKDNLRTIDIPYPFPPENIRVSVDASLDTRYRMRKVQLPRLTSRIRDVFAGEEGTWMAFFPSYAYMEMTAGDLEVSRLPIIRQAPGMTVTERNDFISLIESGGHLVFTVSGGIFSEGVDLRIPDLKGALIVGPCLPGVDLRSKLLAARFDELDQDAFLHTWVIPGMNRVIQAAGRLVRSSEDRVRIVLIGRRFTQPPYVHLLPSHWFSDGAIELLT